ncbi:MAG: glucose-1-phosphate thymidylyltransferase [Halococcoides sp.]
MKGVILAGGTGSRLRPITHAGPKQLIPVGNTPLIEYAIADLRAAGITDIAVVLGNDGRTALREHLGDGSDFGVDITYVVQGPPRGVAHAIGCAEAFVDGEAFVVYLGDNILAAGIEEQVERFRTGAYAAGIAVQRVEDPGRFGVVVRDRDGRVERLVEKPDDPPTDLALVGIYRFTDVVFDVIDDLEPSARGELEVTDAIQRIVDRGHDVDCTEVSGWWKDTGRPEDILDANRQVLDGIDRSVAGSVEAGATVEGRVALADGARVESGAVVRGPASIAEGAVVGAGATVGPYTSIGPDSDLRAVHVENSVLVGSATVTVDDHVVDSLLGRGVTLDGSGLEGRRLVVGADSTIDL